MNKVKFGVVGLHRGQGHLFAAKFAPHVEIVAVADLDKELADSVAAKFNVPNVYYSLDELLEKTMIAMRVDEEAINKACEAL